MALLRYQNINTPSQGRSQIKFRRARSSEISSFSVSLKKSVGFTRKFVHKQQLSEIFHCIILEEIPLIYLYWR